MTDLDQIREDLLPRPCNDAPAALGLCIFAGGFSLGMEEAGIDVVGHFELPGGMALGVNASRQRWPVHVAELDGWKAAARSLPTKPDIIYANPPCVAYAGTGKHEGTGDERMCYVRYCAYEMAMEIQPTIWAWELVPGIFDKDRQWLDAMSFRAAKLGYECTAFLTSSALHGGFQDRRRFHFVASRVKLDFEGADIFRPVRTLGDALRAVEIECDRRLGVGESPLPNHTTVYRGAFQTLFPHVAPGMHLGALPDAIMHSVYRPNKREWTGDGRPGFAHMRGRLDRPSPNILGGHTIIHPTEDRYLTPRECATVMGFPLDYRFSEGTKAYAEIGKGLCTHNAWALGTVLRAGLAASEPANVERHGPLRVVDWRKRSKAQGLAQSAAACRAWYEARHGTPAPEGYGNARH